MRTKPDINRLRYECGTSDLTRTEAYEKYQETMFKGTLQAKINSTSGTTGESKDPVCIGQIDAAKTDGAIWYFGEEIRKSD